MKIIKHCHEEGAGNTEVAQGVLLGLVVDERLEITNCFPFPRHADDVDEGKLFYFLHYDHAISCVFFVMPPSFPSSCCLQVWRSCGKLRFYECWRLIHLSL